MNWKNTERQIARHLNGERVPITGRQRGSAPDIAHDWLSIEAKHREKLPGWLHDAMKQAEASKRGNQLPIVVLHEKGKRHRDNFVIVRLGDFVDWFGDNQPHPDKLREKGL